MSNKKKICLFCEHFQLKVMLNGYDGVCDEHGMFAGMLHSCDQFELSKLVDKEDTDELQNV